MFINPRVFHLIFAMMCLIASSSGVWYELKRGKTRLITPECRAACFTLVACQWLVAMLIIVIYPDINVINIVMTVSLYLLLLTPSILLILEAVVYKFRKSWNEG